ncbi:MAG TPA: 16S rRNA (guanine(527)-N(7))-methyltransferase RsmG [Vicinamibacterales bacterium]|nr:16S rRNA (guanine(527)-N(7))-methyltransferase RsmG [Vicinamibacterales bacterium]
MVDLAALLDARAGLAGISLDAGLKTRLLDYYALLARWNRKINLTSLSDPTQAIDRLLLEPVAAARHLTAGAVLIDLGSGGGSPAIPLALALGSPRLVMVESRSRKAAFLREAAREVGVSAVVEAVRFEELKAAGRHAHSADVVSMRAVRPNSETLGLAQSLAKPDGILAVFTSQSEAVPVADGLVDGSTWNILGSAMLITFHVKH